MRSSVLTRGLVGAVLCFAALSTAHALTVPLFWPIDEVSHVAYAWEVTGGRLPTIDTDIPAVPVPGLQQRLDFERALRYGDRMDIWTSNHPPLFFALSGLPLRLGHRVGLPLTGMVAARLLAVLFGAAGVVFTGLLAAALLPGRPAVAVTAAAFAGLTPALVHFSGLVFSDALSFTLATATLYAAVRLLQHGPTPARLAVVAAVAAAGALTRVSGLALAAVAAGICAFAAWRHEATNRLAAAIGAGGAVVAGTAVASGWFYVLNWQRYGDLTGATALLEKFNRGSTAPPTELLSTPMFWVRQVDRLLSDLSTGVWFTGWTVWLARGVALLAVVGAVVALIRFLVRRGWRSHDVDRLVGGIAVMTVPLLLVVATARFHAAGGSPHGRYLLPGLAGLAVAAAVGLRGPGSGWSRWPAVIALGGLLVLNLGLLWRLQVEGMSWFVIGDRFHSLLRLQLGAGWVWAFAVLVLLGAGLGLLVSAVLGVAAAERDKARL